MAYAENCKLLQVFQAKPITPTEPLMALLCECKK
jgi:hypothetical protein